MSLQLPVRLPPLGRLEKLWLVLLTLSAASWLVERIFRWKPPGRDLLLVVTFLTALLLIFKGLRLAIRTLLWRVRNRMIVLFLFIGLVPLLLVTVLVGLAGYVVTGQVAVQMASSELDRRASRLHGAAAALAWILRTADPGRRSALVSGYLEPAASSWPGLRALVRDSGRNQVFPASANLDPPYPGLRDFRWIVRRDDKFFLLAHVSGPAHPGEAFGAEPLTARQPGVAPVQKTEPPRAPGPVEVALLAPLSESYLASLAPGLGRISLVPVRQRPGGGFVATPAELSGALGTRTPLPPPANRLDPAVTWLTLPFPIEHWRDGDPETYATLEIQTRPSAVFRLLFGQRVDVAQGVVIFFILVGTTFLIVELLSLVVGISITRTLTSSVHELYEGTQKVNEGIFSYRIPISGHDQLAELSRSFNSMTESIERLIVESQERQRLASELAIAREVQEQLFPKEPPVLRGLEILGVCNAARSVSGDYFDFVKLSEDRLALAIADVSGKGIQGALLMASIQSMLRTQLWAARDDGEGVWRFPTAAVVSQLNVQLHHNTAPEKYATFFFGAYDDRQGRLIYTNAGHLPPVLIRNGEPRRLDVNGMVVGVFPSVPYEQSELELCSGDLLVAFTDGVTEPENEFAEEFGEQRLIELLVRHWRRPVREIIDEVIAAVGQWTGRPELQDDMTMVVARRL
ncbi:MAG: SpoIIE family protein phosphatase [Acidobacteria bacterium]|nr:SpoIIE family protein phosphatase [Acidobacteriota bacterium]